MPTPPHPQVCDHSDLMIQFVSACVLFCSHFISTWTRLVRPPPLCGYISSKIVNLQHQYFVSLCSPVTVAPGHHILRLNFGILYTLSGSRGTQSCTKMMFSNYQAFLSSKLLSLPSIIVGKTNCLPHTSLFPYTSPFPSSQTSHTPIKEHVIMKTIQKTMVLPIQHYEPGWGSLLRSNLSRYPLAAHHLLPPVSWTYICSLHSGCKPSDRWTHNRLWGLPP